MTAAAAKAERDQRRQQCLALIEERLDKAFDGSMDSILQAYLRTKEKLDDIATGFGAPIRQAARLATDTKTDLLRYMVANRIEALVLPSEDDDNHHLLSVKFSSTSSKLLTSKLFSTLVLGLTRDKFVALAAEVAQEREAAIAKWRAAHAKKLIQAAKKDRDARAKLHKRPPSKKRGFLSKVAAAAGIADAARDLGSHVEDVVRAGKVARRVLDADLDAADADIGTACASISASAASEKSEADETNEALEARILAEVGAMTPDVTECAEAAPLTVRRVLTLVVHKCLAEEVRPVKPTLSVTKLTKAAASRGTPVASAREWEVAHQWLEARAKVAAAKAAIKPRTDELKLALQVCETRMRPLLEAKHRQFVHTARFQERKGDEAGNPLVRTVSASIVRREVSPKMVPFQAVKDMVRQVSDATVWPEADEAFDAGRHTDLLVKEGSVVSMVAASVLDAMKQFMAANFKVVERVCVRRARPMPLEASVEDMYADLEGGHEDDDSDQGSDEEDDD
jgi:hypothetical protein